MGVVHQTVRVTMGSEVRIEHYPVEKFGDPNSRILVVGQSGAGKTIAMYYVLAAIHGREGRIHRALGFSLSERGNGVLGGMPGETGILPKSLVHGDEFDPKALDDLIEDQRGRHESGMPRDAMVIMEDLMCDPSVANSREVRKLLTNGCHVNLGTMATAHGVTGPYPAISENFEVIVAFDMVCETKKLYERFFRTEFDSFADFKACYEPIVNPPSTPDREGKWRRRRAIVLDKRRPAGERVFSLEVPLAHAQSWARMPGAPIVPLPKLCDPVHWSSPSLDPVKKKLEDLLAQLNSYSA